MDESLEKLITKLNNVVENEDFIDVAHDIIEKIEEREDKFNAVEPILKLIENNSNINFGNPGPLVHFVEKFYKKGYEEKLVESIKRRATRHSLWMLNRIINDSEKNRKAYFLNLFDEILQNPNSGKEIVSLTNQFKNLHV